MPLSNSRGSSERMEYIDNERHNSFQDVLSLPYRFYIPFNEYAASHESTHSSMDGLTSSLPLPQVVRCGDSDSYFLNQRGVNVNPVG